MRLKLVRVYPIADIFSGLFYLLHLVQVTAEKGRK